jgi:AraC-like DNA-binding protein
MHLVKLANRQLSWGQIARLLHISPRYARRLYLENNPQA